MSEEKSCFRIKKGDIEIEYEGKSSEVNARYKEAFEWIKAVTISPSKPPPKKEDTGKKKKAKKPAVRAKGVTAEIDKLIEEGWMDNYKLNAEVMKELKRRGITGVYIQAIDAALRRRLGKTLERKKDEKDNWIYRRMKESGG